MNQLPQQSEYGVSNRENIHPGVSLETVFWNGDNANTKGCTTQVFEYRLASGIPGLANHYDKRQTLGLAHRDLIERGYDGDTRIRLLDEIPEFAMPTAQRWPDLLLTMLNHRDQRLEIGLCITDNVKEQTALGYVGFQKHPSLTDVMIKPYKSNRLPSNNFFSKWMHSR